MYPLHDNDLDRLSREAAEHFEVEPGASGWEHLENRLDEELPQKKKRRRFLFWLFFITITSGGALIGILKYQPVTPLAKNTAEVVAPAGNTSIAKDKVASGSNTTAVTPSPSSRTTTTTNPNAVTSNPEPLPAATTPTTNTVNNDQRMPNTATTPDKNITKPIGQTNNPNTKPASHTRVIDKTPLTLNYGAVTPNNRGNNTRRTTKQAVRKPGQQQRTTAGKNNQSIYPGPDNTTVPDTRTTTTNQPTNGEPVTSDNNAVTTQPDPITTVDSTKNNNMAIAPVTDSAKTLVSEPLKKQDDRQKDKIKQPLELGLIAGPDKSTVAFGPLYKTGYNFGLYVGYRFSNRWSVNTGIIYTKKFYQADSQYFHYKTQGPWDLDKVDGNCTMWEIPVNVRYDVSFNDKRRWFVNTGLSTYLMDKENYTLHYVSPSGNPYPYPWNLDSNTNYLFSIVNLSVGMERSLGRHFSIQAEPYLKIPLQGLGKGDMRMDSYGVLFTLKYKPTFKTKRK